MSFDLKVSSEIENEQDQSLKARKNVYGVFYGLFWGV